MRFAICIFWQPKMLPADVCKLTHWISKEANSSWLKNFLIRNCARSKTILRAGAPN